MIYKIITCSLIGILSHGIIALHVHDRWEDTESLAPTVISLLLAVVIEVIAWEILGLV